LKRKAENRQAGRETRARATGLTGPCPYSRQSRHILSSLPGVTWPKVAASRPRTIVRKTPITPYIGECRVRVNSEGRCPHHRANPQSLYYFPRDTTMRQLLSCLVTTLFLVPVQAAGKYHEVSYPPSDAAGELALGVTYTVWVPDG